MEKGKATWDVSSTEIFINACIEQICNRERQGTSFTKLGWNRIVSTFNAKTGKSYDKKQLKNRLDILRKEWRTWEKLFSKETGIGWDAGRSIVTAEDWWWQQKIKENKLYEKYRYNGMMFARELKIIFKDVMASGEDMFAPSITQPQTQREEEEEDVYRPTMDQEEGSGDSEDDHFGINLATSTGVTDELTNIDLTTNTTSVSGSYGKRKRSEGSRRKQKQKAPTSRVLVDAISVIATASKERTSTLNKIKEASIGEVTAELLSIEEIANDDDLRTRCLKLMMHKTCRDMFVALKGQSRDYLLHWLRDMAYNPPPWLKAPTS